MKKFMALVFVALCASSCTQMRMTEQELARHYKASRLVESVRALAQDTRAAEKAGVIFKDCDAFIVFDGPEYVGVLSFESSSTIVVNNGPCDIYDTDLDGEYDDGSDCPVGWEPEVIQESYESGLDAALERIGEVKTNRPRAAQRHPFSRST